MSEAAERLVERAAALGARLAPEHAGRLLRYLDAMLEINRVVNLTGVRDPEQAVVLHALDGLAFARAGIEPRHVLDLGTGNGFPGVAVAALCPGASVVLMDRTGKKVRAIGSALVTAGVDAAEVVQLDAAQAPSLRPEMRHAFDTVLARAVGRPEVVAPLAEPLCRPGGHLVLWLEEGAEAPSRLGRFRLERRASYELPEPAPRRRMLGVWRSGK